MKKIIVYACFISMVFSSFYLFGKPVKEISSQSQKSDKKEKLSKLPDAFLEEIDIEEITKQLEHRFSEMKENLKLRTEELEELNGTLALNIENLNEVFSTENTDIEQDQSPTLTEKKTFSKIDKIEIDHSYGNIFINETNGKEIEVEIQYFDNTEKKATVEIGTTKQLLSIHTIYENQNDFKRNSNVRINYILSIPKNVGLTVYLKYGNLKFKDFSNPFTGNISYGNLDANDFTGIKPSLRIRYGNLTINKVDDISITTDYSNLKISHAKKIELSGKYNNYTFENVDNIVTPDGSSYNNFNIGNIKTFESDVKYGSISIDNIESDLSVVCAYTTVRVNNLSKQFKNMSIKGSYSDIIIDLNPELSVNFEVDIRYGDLIVSQKYDVKYRENTDRDNRVSKKGTIGDKTPTANFILSNTYSDIRIK